MEKERNIPIIQHWNPIVAMPLQACPFGAEPRWTWVWTDSPARLEQEGRIMEFRKRRSIFSPAAEMFLLLFADSHFEKHLLLPKTALHTTPHGNQTEILAGGVRVSVGDRSQSKPEKQPPLVTLVGETQNALKHDFIINILVIHVYKPSNF